MDTMDRRVELAKAFILHTRPYQESSLIVDVFSRDHGRFSGVVKGARRKNSRKQGLLQPFIPLLISWQGKSELKTITQLEYYQPPIVLPGAAVFSGLYLNELLIKILHKFDPHEAIFDRYRLCLQAIADHDAIEVSLRQFERFILHDLGYGFSFSTAIGTEAGVELTIQPEKFYQFDPQQGFLALHTQPSEKLQAYCFTGQEILAIDRNDLSQKEVRRSAKRLLRMALAQHLGNEPLKSVAMFQPKKYDS
ncbi:MAG TPA: DNA repair protein RecO [Pseudomonadales bacterium]